MPTVTVDLLLYDGKSLASLDADPIVAMPDFDELACRFGRLNLARLAFASSICMPEAIAAPRAFAHMLEHHARGQGGSSPCSGGARSELRRSNVRRRQGSPASSQKGEADLCLCEPRWRIH